MRIDLTRHAPPGLDAGREGWAFAIALLLVTPANLLTYFTRFSDARARLYMGSSANPRLIPGAVMPDFAEIVDGSFLGFGLVILLLLFMAARHYAHHRSGSRSIYLMRRLPDPLELHRRCLTLPLAGIACTVLLAFLLLLLYYWHYMANTPAECLTPHQWAKLWRAIP